MKVVILCGGKGTRLRELTKEMPKPLIEVGGRPILWHIMKLYAHYGFKDFVLCLGYKGNMIKKYFQNNPEEGWNIQMIDTGKDTKKAERLMKIKDFVGNEFFLAYGDDISNININELADFHKKHGKIATITTVKPENPFGVIEFDSIYIKKFKEKPIMNEWINGGFMILNKKIFEYIAEGNELEEEVFKKLVEKNELCAFKHEGFWKGMNTFKDTQELNNLWENGNAKWKIW